MNWKFIIGIIFIGAIALASGINFSVLDEEKVESNEADWKQEVEDKDPEIATLAGGCFWCIEQIYDGRKGIEEAISGYAGGSQENATYEKVNTGETDHREAVRVKYYPSVISYEEVLDIYWRNIDPTDPRGQFSDRGPQYTTAIYYHDEKQREIAEESKQNVSELERFDEEIVTEIEEYSTFYRAEDYHQNYSRRNTYQYKAYKKASGRSGFIERVWNQVE